MQEIISQIVARVQAIFSQLGDQVRAAMENAAAGKAILAALDVILPVASGVLRILAVFVAILIIVRCCRSIFREKPGKEIWGWLTLADGARLELCHWENALGRGKWADVDLDFPTVSRSHAAREEYRHEAASDFFPAQKFHVRRLDHRVGRFNATGKTAGFYHSQ